MITMSDIANRVGVSRSAVSHVLTGNQGKNVRIPEATRQRILDTAAEMGYRPNELARSVRSGKTRMIGFLVSEPDYEPHWNLIVGALAEAEALGFTLKVLSVTQETVIERTRQCIELRLSGVIMRVIDDKGPIFEELSRAQIPSITVDDGAKKSSGPNVEADNASGCRMAIEHLMALGHTRIAFISSDFPKFYQGVGENDDIGTIRERLFLQEMAAQGLAVPEGYVTHEMMSVFGPALEWDDNPSTVVAATEALLNHPEGRPTAIFCWRDETAMVAIDTCRKAGLRIPEDISVVGFSNIRSALFFSPPLSTVKSPWHEMGRTAMAQIARSVNGEVAEQAVTHLIPSGFVTRKSSGPVPR